MVLAALFTFHFSLFISPAGAQTLSGKASYYAKSWTGRRTSNGERLHHDSMTCAHKTLPFGTLLKVTNLLNGKQVVVRVTDRGPYVKGRVVDLSWGAAKAIGMLSQGIAPVTVERVRTSNIPFKPEEDDPDVPKFEFELADIAPIGITPLWQRDMKIDQQKLQRIVTDSIAKSQIPTTSPTPHKSTKADNGLDDETNQKPNAARAYIKRQRQSD